MVESCIGGEAHQSYQGAEWVQNIICLVNVMVKRIIGSRMHCGKVLKNRNTLKFMSEKSCSVWYSLIMMKADVIRILMAVLMFGGLAVTGGIARSEQRCTVQFFKSECPHVALRSVQTPTINVPRLTVKRTNVGHPVKKQEVNRDCGLQLLKMGPREHASEARFVIICG